MTNKNWYLTGARVARDAVKSERLDLEIAAGRIIALKPPGNCGRKARQVDLSGCLILPGLINAHDHLEFNLFPRMGEGPYPSSGAWARHIHRPDKSPLKEHLQVPFAARLRWGAVKNLLSGVTTVSHHNPYHRVFERNFPVRVHKRVGWAHSLEFTADLEQRFHGTPPGSPFILHLGEANDRQGEREIFKLDLLGALTPQTVLVHGVALRARGLRLAKSRGASLVWCPSSNLFMLGRTLDRAALESGIPVALGTDSALTGEGDLLDEIALARRIAALEPTRLYRMVTEEAARILRLNRGEGDIREKGIADLIVVRDRGDNPAATLVKLRTRDLEMVLVDGQVKLIAPRLAGQLPVSCRRRLHSMIVNQETPVFLDVGLPRLFAQASRALGADIHLAGKKVSLIL